MKKTTIINIILAISILLNVFLLFSNINTAEKVDDQSAVSESLAANEKFLDRFFTYKTTKEKYEEIEPLMTEKGYKSTFPSGMEIPEDSSEFSVSSIMSGLKPFQYKQNDSKLEFLNEMTVSTSFNKIETTETIVVKTILVNKENKWFVDEILMIGEIAADE